jgi:hypothetical protein
MRAEERLRQSAGKMNVLKGDSMREWMGAKTIMIGNA